MDERSDTIQNHVEKFSLRLIECLAERESVTWMRRCGDEKPRRHLRVSTASTGSRRV